MIIKTLSEYLADALQGTSLLEMAISRSEFIDKVNSLRPQFFQNLCLVYYAKRYNNASVEHWKRELKTHILNLAKYELKSSSIKDILTKEWIKKLECHKSTKAVYADVWAKLDDEDIDYDLSITLCNKLNAEMYNLIDLISSGDISKIHTYIKDL